MLVVLDNAGSTEQVRPLLPGSATCVTVVTSRDSLAGLVARDGARRLGLDVLPEPEAVGLLRALIGDRVDAEPDAAKMLAARCCRLPLALRVAAELAVARPGESLTFLAAELADLGHRLDLLDADGDSRSAVRAVFSWSYLRLRPDAARAFRLAGLHPGPDFDRFTVAALAATSPESADSTLGQLAPRTPYPARCPPAVRHARPTASLCPRACGIRRRNGRRAGGTDPAVQLLRAHGLGGDGCPIPGGEPPPGAALATGQRSRASGGPQKARAWLDAELPNLVAAIEHAAYHGDPDHAIRIAGTVFRALETTGRYPEIVTVYTCTLHAARRAGDRAGEAEALNNLTVVDLRQSRYQHAADILLQSLDLHEETGNHLGRARALGNLGIILLRQGRYQQAAEGFRHALTLRPDADTESDCLANLGVALLRLGHCQDAMTSLSQALARSRETGSLAREAYCLVHLGLADLRQGRYHQAADQLRRAVALTRKEGDQSGEADALNGVGEVSLAMGRPAPARDQHSRALSIATQIGDRYEQARAHNGLGYASQADGAPEAARRHWKEALAIYADMGVPEAGEVRVRLAAFGSPEPGDSST